MADMERAGSGGTKRKLKENAFTAKAESGTLKVKILRRDQKSVDTLGVVSSSNSSATTKTTAGRTSKQQPPPSNSPPKPRPNRKHVPIFYEPQFRQPFKSGGHSSSTDESVTHSSSSTGVPGIHSTSSTGGSGGNPASTCSTSSSFVAQLSDVRLQSASTSGGEVGPPPRANPLFARNDSDGLGTLGELLRPYFPSSSGLSFPLGGAQPRTTSSAGLLADQPGLSTALHQLASSSASYRSALDELSTHETPASAASVPPMDTSMTATTTTSPTKSDANHNVANGGLETYRFDPFSALQTAIEHARRSSSTNASPNGSNNDKHRDVGSPNSNARFYRLDPAVSSGTTHTTANSATGSIRPPPDLSPTFTLQNSLTGGGIHGFTSSKLPVETSSSNKRKDPASSDEIDCKSTLGPPPETPPSFLLQNSLMGGGISILDLPKTNPSLDRLGSLTSLISQANEATKDLHATLWSPPKGHLSLNRLVSLASVTSDDDESKKDDGRKPSASTLDTHSASPSTTDGAESNDAIDLGPPPTGPPAFTIGNSLMGGGIDLQPAAANVNTQNFDWKLHRSASSNGGDANSARSSGVSHGLRARLERTLAEAEKAELRRQAK